MASWEFLQLSATVRRSPQGRCALLPSEAVPQGPAAPLHSGSLGNHLPSCTPDRIHLSLLEQGPMKGQYNHWHGPPAGCKCDVVRAEAGVQAELSCWGRLLRGSCRRDGSPIGSPAARPEDGCSPGPPAHSLPQPLR